MSQAAARTLAAAPAPAAPSRLKMTRPGDGFETGADQFVSGWAPAGFEARIAAARPERTALPSRSLLEARLGHDLGTVGIHAGPAAASAAAAAGAQAFTVGRDIFFGAGQFRPENVGHNEDLVVHELAHTIQNRPDVVARRTLDGTADPPLAKPGFRTAGPPPAAVQAKPAAPTDAAVATHGQATAAAASTMQRALATVAAGPEQEATDAPQAGGLAAGAATGPPPPPSGAAQAAQEASARLGAQLAGLGAARSRRVEFQQEADSPAGDPVAFARAMQSQSLAGSFVGRAASRVEGVLNAAMAIPGQALAALGVARQAVVRQAATQDATLVQGADAARKSVTAQTGRIRGAIAGRHAAADRAAAAEIQAARDKAQRAHDEADTGLGKRAETEKTRIRRSYVDAGAPMEAVGVTAGALARNASGRRSDALLAQRDGESSILDGPLHDNRLEASAEAAVKVGDEYGKSFEASAVDQAKQIPASQPDVLAKVDEITGQARTGLTTQLDQILQGATALGKGATGHARGAATQMRAALDGAAGQSTAALDTAQAQQQGALAAQSGAAQAALDDAVATGLSGFADGMVEASDQLVGALHGFVDSAAAIPAPERDQLEPALSAADPEGPLGGMAAQLKTFTPGLTGILQEAGQTSQGALQSAAGLARQGFEQSTAGFVTTATGINQQSATGFHKLGAGTKRSAGEVGSSAETGFKEASTNASAAFGQFGDQVDANFKTGRDQMLSGLWSKENQGKLDEQMTKSGDEAASHVQPRWKKVLKWVVTIVVIVAVIAITIASAGALGPVGVILLGAALGAAAGAVQTIANNLIDGEPWSKGVVKAMIVGAIGGAVGGAGGVLLKGVGSVALKITLEFGVNVVGGVAAEAIGTAVTGGTFNFTSALMGALIGAGVGAGLGIAGAIKGKISIGGVGEPAAARPTIEPPPAPPAGKIRAALEGAKILKPRPGVPLPEVNPAVSPGEQPALPPRRQAGFQPPGQETPMIEPESPVPQPRRQAGFRAPGEEAPMIEPDSPVPQPRRQAGFRAPGEDAPMIEPDSPVPQPRRPAGFRPAGDEAPLEMPAPLPDPNVPLPRRQIGFLPPGASEAPMIQPSAPRAPRQIGFGAEQQPAPAMYAAAPDIGQAAPLPDVVAPPRAMMIEPSAPRLGPGGGAEPIRASSSGGGSAMQPPPMPEPVLAPRPQPTVSAEPIATPAKPAPTAAEPAIAEPPAAKPAEPAAAPKPAEPAVAPKPAKPPPAPKPAKPAATAEPAPAPKPKPQPKPVATPETPPHATPSQKARLSRLLARAEDAGLPLGDEQVAEVSKRLGATASAAEIDQQLAALERGLNDAITVKGGFDQSALDGMRGHVGENAPLPEGTQASGTTTKPRTAELTDAEMLAANLEKQTGARPIGHEAHHIVPKGMEAGEEARQILKEAGIGINDPENGIWLPEDSEIANTSTTEIHSRVHTERAIRIITDILREGAKGGRPGVRQALKSIQEILSSGRFER